MAAEKSKILDEINSFKNGFDTMIGERGVQLSGGQRQRLAIARSFYKKAKLSSVDLPPGSPQPPATAPAVEAESRSRSRGKGEGGEVRVALEGVGRRVAAGDMGIGVRICRE